MINFWLFIIIILSSLQQRANPWEDDIITCPASKISGTHLGFNWARWCPYVPDGFQKGPMWAIMAFIEHTLPRWDPDGFYLCYLRKKSDVVSYMGPTWAISGLISECNL